MEMEQWGGAQRRTLLLSLGGGLLLAGAVLSSAPVARAATVAVSTTADDGAGSLREAIANANATIGPDGITFDVSGTILLVTSLPTITDTAGLIIDGAGQSVTIDGGGLVRPFQVGPSASLEIRNLTVQGGRAESASGGGFMNEGGALTVKNSTIRENFASTEGGGIWNSGSLILVDTIVDANSGGAFGGGVFSSGSMSMTRGRMNSNSAENGGGMTSTGPLTINDAELSLNQSSPGQGGAIHATTTGTLATITNTVFNENVSYGGGAIWHVGGELTVTGSTLSGNQAFRRPRSRRYPGGGIANVEGGTLMMTSSAVHQNSSSREGAGIYHTGASMTVANTTVSGNRITEDLGGGGIYIGGPATLTNVTVYGNSAITAGGGIFHDPAAGALSLQNSVLAENSAPSAPDCSTAGSINGGGPNLVQDMGGCSISGTAPIVALALLTPLANNGGATKTHAPFPASPAIDAGSDAICAAAPVDGVDQRGVARPAGVYCDLGAHEGVTAPGPLFNASFESGAAGWTLGGVDGGIARVETEGSCFGANNTLGVTLPGKHSLNVRSSPDAPLEATGAAVSPAFRFGSAITFRALSENDDAAPSPEPVAFTVLLLNADKQPVHEELAFTDIVTLSPGTSNDGCLVGDLRDGAFSAHEVDTSALAGQMGHIEFRQHTNVPGKGFFTLVDDVVVVE